MIDSLSGRTRILAFLAMLLFVPTLAAETVEARLPGGMVASAEFRAGQPARPAVLLLHGFLQTRQAMPLSALADTLSGQGYTTLSPTLSLGINRRSKSLACEAAHLHNLEMDVAELGWWVNWLVKKGYSHIALVGHSSGSIQVLHYVAQQPDPAVKQAFLVSLIGFTSLPDDRKRAHALAKTAPGKLERYSLSYCKTNYTAPPAAYVSYADSSSDRILTLLGKSRLPIQVILGANDPTLDKGWPERLRSRGLTVTTIANSGHFFDGEAEFDLADKLDAQLKSLQPEK